MTIEKATEATTFRFWPSALRRLRDLSRQHGRSQTEILSAAILQFDYARYLREQSEQIEQSSQQAA